MHDYNWRILLQKLISGMLCAKLMLFFEVVAQSMKIDNPILFKQINMKKFDQVVFNESRLISKQECRR